MIPRGADNLYLLIVSPIDRNMSRRVAKTQSVERLKASFERSRASAGREMEQNWSRFLPLDEMLGDRWKKASLLGFGRGTSIYENAYVYGKPAVGRDVWIGPLTILDATGGLEIGDGSEISCGVMIFTHSTHLRTVSERQVDTVRKAVKIGKHVYIGSGAVILPGVTVGDHSIVGAGAVVTSDVPDRRVVFGVPARIVGNVLGEGSSTKIVYDKVG